MNNLRASNPRRLAFFGAAILLLSLAVIFLAQDIIREAIVLPLSYLVWLVGVLVDTSPQMLFWFSTLFIAGLVAYHSLSGRRKALAAAPPELAEEAAHTRARGGQVAYWAQRVYLMRRNPSQYFINSFHQSVTRLLMDALSHRYRMTTRQVEERLREGSLDVPDEVRDYALGGLKRFEVERRPFFADLWASITGLLRNLLRPAGPQNNGNTNTDGRQVSADEEMVRVVVSYLEKELEVSNDDTGR